MSFPKDADTARIAIHQARDWAKDHFNTYQKEDHLLAPPTFDVEFPEPDSMIVWPRCYGKRLQPGITYRLAWKESGLMIWVGRNPFTDLKVELIIA